MSATTTALPPRSRPRALTAIVEAEAARERIRQYRERQARADHAAEVLTEGRTLKPRRQPVRE